MTNDLENNTPVSKVISQIMRRFGYRHQYQVAEYFGVTAQTLSGWLKTNTIPPKHLLKFRSDIQTGLKTDQEAEIVLEKKGADEIGMKPEKISLARFFFLFSKYIKFLMGLPVTITVVAFIYLFFIAKPVYTVTAKILPTGNEGSAISDLTGVASQFGLNLPVSVGEKISWDELYPEIIKSRKLKRVLLEWKFNTEKYGPGNTLLNIMVREFGLAEFPAQRQVKMSVDILGDMIGVSKGRLSPIVTLEVSGFEPQFIADLAAAIIDESGKMQRQFKTRQIRQKRTFIEGRISEVEQALTTAEIKLKEFRETNRRIEKSPSLQLEEERLVRALNLQNSIYITLQSQYEKAKIQEVEESAMIQLIDEPVPPYRRTRPRRLLLLVISAFFGSVLACFVVYSKEYLISNGTQERILKTKAWTQLKRNLKDLSPFRRFQNRRSPSN